MKAKPLTTCKMIFVETPLSESLKNSLPIQHTNSSPLTVEPPSNLSNFHDEYSKSTKSHLNLEDLYDYLDKNIENLKINLELKTFGFKNDSLYFKKSLIREFQKKFNKSKITEIHNLNNETNLEEITNKTIIDTLQDLIDHGKIQHAFIIYSAFRNRIQLPQETLKRWNYGYLGFKYYSHEFFIYSFYNF